MALPRRVATLSVHTSPLDQPGCGDAGGMNVYVTEVAQRLAEHGIEIEIFTRATSSDLPPTVELAPGVTVRHVTAGPYEGLDKNDLPAQLCAFTSGVMREEAAARAGLVRPRALALLAVGPGRLAGQGTLGCATRPHDAHHGEGQERCCSPRATTRSRRLRAIGEAQVVEAADRLIASTADEATQLVELYDADPARVDVVAPGVDLAIFTPGDRIAVARCASGCRQTRSCCCSSAGSSR